MTGRRRGLLLIGIAAVAGMLAGLVAVYVKQSGEGKPGEVALADCTDALATAEKVAPLATGEVAAFRVAEAADPLTDLAFTGPDGSPVTIADFAGQTILVNLWATWCVPCRQEMPALDRLQAALGGDDFSVVAVNVDVRNPERAQAFLADIGVSGLDFYADPTSKVLSELKRRGLALGLPTTVLVDGKGCRIGVVEGPAEWDSDDAKALIGAAIS
jgi:thiol-disulfide isomerase/thioredoxin